MKNRKMMAFLIVFALLQLAFPVAPIVYERSFIASVAEKGESYTLEFDGISLFNKECLTIDRYNVKIGGDYENMSYLSFYDASYFFDMIIEKDKDGVCTVYTADTEGKVATDYNLFRANKAFNLDFEDYDFAGEGIGMRELFELCCYLCYDDYGVESYEEFADPDAYSSLHEIDLDGKVVLSIYKGMPVIKEFYIGDELVLRRK